MNTEPTSIGGWYFYKDGRWEEAEAYNKIVAERNEARDLAREFHHAYLLQKAYIDWLRKDRDKVREEYVRSTEDAVFVTLELQKDCKRLRKERDEARLQLLDLWDRIERNVAVFVPYLSSGNRITSEWCPRCGGNRFVDALTGDIRCKDCLVVEKPNEDQS